MERFAWFIQDAVRQIDTVKSVIISLLKRVPLLNQLSQREMEWVFVAIMFLTLLIVIRPLVKWSVTIAVVASLCAGLLALVTSYSFWGFLPFTGLGVAIVLFSNRFQMG